MEGSGYEKKVLHYMNLLTNYWSKEKPKCEGSEPNSDVDSPSNDLHQRYLDEKLGKHKRGALPHLQPRSLRKATKIVNATIAYGLANGILTKKGPGLYLNHEELNPIQNVEEDIQMPSTSRVEPEQETSNVDRTRTTVELTSQLPLIMKERLSNGNLPRLKRLQANARIKRRTHKKPKMRRRAHRH
ncbi:hypothetical protein RI129_001908 [Pyrocoelia pectoralis]|uniref:Uncharacterized protein n=1 Tax=Pyrocoelia pectoralis TaxID=417401 RepID=A0AAN7VWN3_9COLE